MGDYKKLCELIDREIDKEVAKGSLTPDTIRTIGYGIDVIKDIKSIEEKQSEMEQGYSGGRGYMPFYAYDDGMSYAQRRDSRGRYSREGRSYDGSYEGSYRRGGYSRDEQIDTLQRMMENARNDQEREAIRKTIVAMESN